MIVLAGQYLHRNVAACFQKNIKSHPYQLPPNPEIFFVHYYKQVNV